MPNLRYWPWGVLRQIYAIGLKGLKMNLWRYLTHFLTFLPLLHFSGLHNFHMLPLRYLMGTFFYPLVSIFGVSIIKLLHYVEYVSLVKISSRGFRKLKNYRAPTKNHIPSNWGQMKKNVPYQVPKPLSYFCLSWHSLLKAQSCVGIFIHVIRILHVLILV